MVRPSLNKNVVRTYEIDWRVQRPYVIRCRNMCDFDNCLRTSATRDIDASSALRDFRTENEFRSPIRFSTIEMVQLL